MLYVKHVTKSGKEKFFPILDTNVYVFCDRCEQMVLVPDPAGYIYELGACSDSIRNADLCDACNELYNRIMEKVRQISSVRGNDLHKGSHTAIIGSGERVLQDSTSGGVTGNQPVVRVII